MGIERRGGINLEERIIRGWNVMAGMNAKYGG
jgi:hypothetical protein